MESPGRNTAVHLNITPFILVFACLDQFFSKTSCLKVALIDRYGQDWKIMVITDVHLMCLSVALSHTSTTFSAFVEGFDHFTYQSKAVRTIHLSADRIDRTTNVVYQPHVSHSFSWIMCQHFFIHRNMNNSP